MPIPCSSRARGVCSSSRTCPTCRPRTFGGSGDPAKVSCWAQDKNGDRTPFDVAPSSKNKYWFRCSQASCGHDFETRLSDVRAGQWCPYCKNQDRCDEPACALCTSHSFAGCTIPRALACWSKTRNDGLTPRDVALNCNKRKYWFDCDACGHSFDALLGNVNKGHWCKFCDNKERCDELACALCTSHSFAGCETSRALACWSRTRNDGLTPRDVALNCHKRKYWFDCDACGHTFDTLLGDVNKDQWCPYCDNKERCDELDCALCTSHSFAGCTFPRALACWSRTRNDGLTPRDVALNCGRRKYWFDCDACGHTFDMLLGHVNKDQWCPYCDNKERCDELVCALCTSHSFAGCTFPRALACWSRTRNDGLTPRDVALNCGRRKYWFDCDACKHTFDMLLGNVNKGQWCPMCKKKTEQKLVAHLLTTADTVATQFRINAIRSWPFDAFIAAVNAIIELDGAQHFIQVSNWRAHTATRDRDVLKMVAATAAGHHVVRLSQEDVWFDRIPWQRMLASTLLWLASCAQPVVVYVTAGSDRWDQHSTELAEASPRTPQYMMGADGDMCCAAEAVACRALAQLQME